MGRGIVIEIWIINGNDRDIKLVGQRQQILKLTFRAVALYQNQWKNDKICVVIVQINLLTVNFEVNYCCKSN